MVKRVRLAGFTRISARKSRVFDWLRIKRDDTHMPPTPPLRHHSSSSPPVKTIWTVWSMASTSVSAVSQRRTARTCSWPLKPSNSCSRDVLAIMASKWDTSMWEGSATTWMSPSCSLIGFSISGAPIANGRGYILIRGVPVNRFVLHQVQSPGGKCVLFSRSSISRALWCLRGPGYIHCGYNRDVYNWIMTVRLHAPHQKRDKPCFLFFRRTCPGVNTRTW